MAASLRSWVESYLHALCRDDGVAAARAALPLWLTHESVPGIDPSSGRTAPPARLTIQTAVEVYPRLVVIGSSGSGKSTLIRQLALDLAEAALADGPAREARLVPLLIPLADFSESIEAVLALLAADPPPLAEIASEYAVALLLDGLDELPPERQLSALAVLGRAAGLLGPRGRWVATCRSEDLSLYLPWLTQVEVRSIRQFAQRDVLALAERAAGGVAAQRLQAVPAMIDLATRPRWLSVLTPLLAGEPASPPRRGQLLARWVPAVLQATTHAHAGDVTLVEAAITALPGLAEAFDAAAQPATVRELLDMISIHAGVRDPLPLWNLLRGAGIVTLRDGQWMFASPLLHAIAHALGLAQRLPDNWTDDEVSQADVIILAIGLHPDPAAVLRRLLQAGAVDTAARAMADAFMPTQFETLLTASGAVSPALRVSLAETLSSIGLVDAAREQLEQAGHEGYDEAGLFGRLGDLYSVAGHWVRARAAYEQALDREPGDLRYLQQLGIVCGRLGASEDAAGYLQQVLREQQRRSAEAAHELGHVYLQQGRYEQALDEYQRVANLFPGLPNIQRSLGMALRRLGHIDQAEIALAAALRQDPHDACALAEQGLLYAAQGRIQPAIETLERAAVLEPHEPEHSFQLGKLYHQLGDLAAAEQALRHALELAPTFAVAHFHLGLVAAAAGRQEAALTALRQAVRLDPGQEPYHRQLGVLLRAAGQLDEAAQALGRALELRPDAPDSHSELARLLWQRGQHAAALAEHRRAAALAPDDPEYQHRVGLACRQIDLLREAVDHLRRAAILAPERPDVRYDLAQAYVALDDHQAALDELETAVRLAPQDPRCWQSLGMLRRVVGHGQRARQALATALRLLRRSAAPQPAILAAAHSEIAQLHLQANRTDRAVIALRRAVAARPADPGGYIRLGAVLWERGQLEEAGAALETAARLDPADLEAAELLSCVLEATGSLHRALDLARQVARERVREPGAQVRLGDLALNAGRPHEALACAARAIAILDETRAAPATEDAPVPGSAPPGAHLPSQLRASALLLQARAERALGQPARALERARQAQRIEPGLALADVEIGLAMVALGNPAGAITVLEQAAARNGAHEEVVAALRDLYAARGDRQAALLAAQRAIALAPQRVAHTVRLAALLRASGALDEAAACLADVLAHAPDVPEIHIELAQVAAARGDWAAAQDCAARAITRSPENGELRLLLATSAAQLGDLGVAIDELTRATIIDPCRADWLAMLADLHMQSDNPTEALTCLRRAMRLTPHDARLLERIATCLIALDEPVAAAETLEQALRIDPQRHDWRADLAQLYAARGWHQEALLELNRAVAGDPGITAAWAARGQIHRQLGNLAAARADLAQALALAPHAAEILAEYAEVLSSLGLPALARQYAEQAFELLPSGAHALQLAAARRADNDPLGAADAIEYLIECDPAPGLWFALATDYESAGEIEAALDAVTAGLQQAPQDAELRALHGHLLARTGHLEAAEQMLQGLLACNPTHAPALAELTLVLLALGRAQDALAFARRAVATGPKSPATWRLLGTALRLSGSPAEAIVALRRGLEIAPHDPQIAFQLGLAALQVGNAASAEHALTRAITADPHQPGYHAALARARRLSVPLPTDLDDLGYRLTLSGYRHVPQPADPQRASILQPALEAARQATALQPATGRWQYELGMTRLAAGLYVEAAQSFDLAFSTADGPGVALVEARQRRALALIGAGDLHGAEAALQNLELDTSGQYLLGQIALARGDSTAAGDLFAAIASDHPDYRRVQLYLGYAALVRSDYPQAVAALERALAQDGQHAPTLAALAAAYRGAGRTDRAIATARAATQLDPAEPEYHVELAESYAMCSRIREARVALMSALSLDPHRAAWHARLGDFAAQLGLGDAARASYARAASLAPQEPAHLQAQATLALQQGRTAEALVALEQAIALDPSRAALHAELANIHTAAGRYEAARDSFRQAVECEPGMPAYWLGLIQAYDQSGQQANAEEATLQAIARFPTEADVHSTYARQLDAAGRSLEALRHYELAATCNPTDAAHLWRLGGARLRNGDRAGAHEALEHALQLDPDCAPALAYLSQLRLEAGDERGALRDLERAAHLAPTDAVGQRRLGELYLRLGKLDQAYSALSQAACQLSGDAELLTQLGEVALDLGLNREALEHLDRASDLDPDNPRYHYLCGVAHRRLKQYSRAIDRLRRAVRLRPGYAEALKELSMLGPLAFVAKHIG